MAGVHLSQLVPYFTFSSCYIGEKVFTPNPIAQYLLLSTLKQTVLLCRKRAEREKKSAHVLWRPRLQRYVLHVHVARVRRREQFGESSWRALCTEH